MNTNESNRKGTVICSWCCYDANPIGAKRCQKCGKPLVISSVPTYDKTRKLSSTSYKSWLGLALVLLLVGGGGYYFWQEFLTTTSSLNRSFEDNSSDIPLYNSMKEVPNVPEGTFNYGGTLTLASLTAQGTHKAMTQAHPNFRLRYTPPRHGTPDLTKSITMLLDGELSFILSSRPLEDAEYTTAKQRGFRLEQIPVAIDGIGCYTHPDVSIPGLSLEQLQGIYQGKITNWKQVGGADLPIVPFGPNQKSGSLVKLLVPPEAKGFSSRVQSVSNYTESVRKVATTPGAIGIGSAGLIVQQKTVRPVALAAGKSNQYVPITKDGNKINAAAFQDGTYPLTRRVFVIIRRDQKLDEKAGVAYSNLLLSKEGQGFVEKAGMIPIR